MIQCNPLEIYSKESFSWLYFEYLSDADPGDVKAFSKNESSVFPHAGSRAVAFQRGFVVPGPSLQKALVFLTKGL